MSYKQNKTKVGKLPTFPAGICSTPPGSISNNIAQKPVRPHAMI